MSGSSAIENFIKGFLRDRFGAWRCIAPATLALPGGRVQVCPGAVFVKGTRFMNIDLAEILEKEYQRQQRQAAVAPKATADAEQ